MKEYITIDKSLLKIESAKTETTIPKRFFPNNVLVFDLIGSNAHFRNIQTNSTSLSYSFPSPTVIYGLIAGILGKKRDSYYDLFQPFNIFLAIDIKSQLRKELFTVNYRVYRDKEKGYTQIPLELIFPLDSKELRYRIYFAINDNEVYTNLADYLREDKAIYPPYLGLTEMIARIEYLGEFSIIKVEQGKKVELNNIIPTKKYIIQESDMYEPLILYPEYMRYNFKANRKPGEMKKFFYIAKGKFKVEVGEADEIYKLSIDDNLHHIARL